VAAANSVKANATTSRLRRPNTADMTHSYATGTQHDPPSQPPAD
jgi:hypothetical protein